MQKLSGLDKFSLVLLIIGGLNWGLVGFLRFDLVAAIFGGQAAVISRVIFALVGIAALWSIGILFKSQDQKSATRQLSH